MHHEILFVSAAAAVAAAGLFYWLIQQFVYSLIFRHLLIIKLAGEWFKESLWMLKWIVDSKWNVFQDKDEFW